MISEPRWRAIAMCLIIGTLAVSIGLAIQIQGDKALLAPSYRYVKTIAPYWVWSLLFMVPGIVTDVLMLTQDRRRAAIPLTLGAGYMVFWAVLLGAGSVAASGAIGIIGVATWLSLAGLTYIAGQAVADL